MSRREANAELQVECNVQKSMDSRIDPTVELRITENKSGLPLVQVQFTAGEFLSMVTGSVHDKVEGWIQPNLDRIGKKMVHRQIDVPRQVTYGIPYSRERGHADADAAVRAWAWPLVVPGEDIETRNTNQGWKVIFRSYVTEED